MTENGQEREDLQAGQRPRRRTQGFVLLHEKPMCKDGKACYQRPHAWCARGLGWSA